VTDSLANVLKRANPAYRAAHLGKWQWFHTPESMGYDLSDGITMNEDGDSTDPEDPKRSFSMTRRAGEFMTTQVKEGHPFYLQLSDYAVHQTPQALASTLKKYEGLSGGGGRGDRAVVAAMTEVSRHVRRRGHEKLDELGIANETVVIYMSDNGGRTEILQGGKGNVFEGGLRVPLIGESPRPARRGVLQRSRGQLRHLSRRVPQIAAPGFALPKGIEGGSRKPVRVRRHREAKRPIDRLVFHQAVEVDHPQTALRKGDYKLLYYWDLRQSQLFNLVEDLSESHDLAEQPAMATGLLAELKAHVRAGLGEQAFGALERGEFPKGGPGGRPRKPRPQ